MEQEKEERVVLVRNPWASNRYNGAWEWGNSKWTAKAKEVTGYDDIYQ